MKITKAVLRITSSLLCAALIFSGLPLQAAGSSEELRHEAFMRGGTAISVALNANETAPAVSRAIVAESPAALPAPAPAPAPAKQAGGGSKGMSKTMWTALVGGFAASGFIIYWAATGPGASIRNCSTCSK